jgi:hypothetical protein
MDPKHDRRITWLRPTSGTPVEAPDSVKGRKIRKIRLLELVFAELPFFAFPSLKTQEAIVN